MVGLGVHQYYHRVHGHHYGNKKIFSVANLTPHPKPVECDAVAFREGSKPILYNQIDNIS